MASIFYQDKFDRQIPLTGLFLECLGNYVKELGDELTDEAILHAVQRALMKSELRKEPSEEDLAYVAEELTRRSAAAEERQGDAKATSIKGRYFSGYLTDWAYGLNFDKLCLYVADYDYPKARELYETLDQQSVVALADEKLRLEFERARVTFEAALFGFGGGYKDTPKEGDATFDLTDDNQSAERALKNMGF